MESRLAAPIAPRVPSAHISVAPTSLAIAIGTTAWGPTTLCSTGLRMWTATITNCRATQVRLATATVVALGARAGPERGHASTSDSAINDSAYVAGALTSIRVADQRGVLSHRHRPHDLHQREPWRSAHCVRPVAWHWVRAFICGHQLRVVDRKYTAVLYRDQYLHDPWSCRGRPSRPGWPPP
eukprot:SAG22_NODE_379_length_11417_cov_211.325647_1_plen_183_part_00